MFAAAFVPFFKGSFVPFFKGSFVPFFKGFAELAAGFFLTLKPMASLLSSSPPAESASKGLFWPTLFLNNVPGFGFGGLFSAFGKPSESKLTSLRVFFKPFPFFKGAGSLDPEDLPFSKGASSSSSFLFLVFFSMSFSFSKGTSCCFPFSKGTTAASGNSTFAKVSWSLWYSRLVNAEAKAALRPDLANFLTWKRRTLILSLLVWTQTLPVCLVQFQWGLLVSKDSKPLRRGWPWISPEGSSANKSSTNPKAWYSAFGSGPLFRLRVSYPLKSFSSSECFLRHWVRSPVSTKGFLKCLAPPLPAISTLFQRCPCWKVPFFKGSFSQRFPFLKGSLFSKVPFSKGFSIQQLCFSLPFFQR